MTRGTLLTLNNITLSILQDVSVSGIAEYLNKLC